MTDEFNEPVRQDTLRLQALLRSTPGVTEVEKARAFIAQDETGALSNMLTFRFHEVQFFARAWTGSVRDTHRDGKPPTEFTFIRPGQQSERERVVGVLHEEHCPPEAVQTLLRTYVTPAVSITADGDAVFGGADLRGDTLLSKVPYLTHAVCRGAVNIRETTPRHLALTCGACGLRVVVPTTVATINDLRSHFAPYQPEFRDAVSLERGQAEIRASGG